MSRCWYPWLLSAAVTGSFSAGVRTVEAEPPPVEAASQDTVASTCAWPEESGQRVLTWAVDSLSVQDETVGSIVARLHASQDVPLSFIENDAELRLSFTMRHVTVQQILDKVVERAPVYRYVTIAGHLVLYPRSTKWDARLDALRLGPASREKVAAQLGRLIQRLPVFADFGGLVVAGKTNTYLFEDPVLVAGSGSVVELLVQLLGSRPSATFSILKMPAPWGQLALFLGGVRSLQSLKLSSPSTVLHRGQKVQLRVVGVLRDGTHKDLTAGACLTTYRVSDTKIVTVSADGLLTAHGSGPAWVEAVNTDGIDLLEIQVSPSGSGTTGTGAALPPRAVDQWASPLTLVDEDRYGAITMRVKPAKAGQRLGPP
jgi:hypothetical protein